MIHFNHRLEVNFFVFFIKKKISSVFFGSRDKNKYRCDKIKVQITFLHYQSVIKSRYIRVSSDNYNSSSSFSESFNAWQNKTVIEQCQDKRNNLKLCNSLCLFFWVCKMTVSLVSPVIRKLLLKSVIFPLKFFFSYCRLHIINNESIAKISINRIEFWYVFSISIYGINRQFVFDASKSVTNETFDANQSKVGNRCST